MTSETSVDPIAELKVVPGIDTNKLQTFDTEAKAAARRSRRGALPPPPSPPPPKLVQDDDDFAVGPDGRRAVATASACALAVIALLR